MLFQQFSLCEWIPSILIPNKYIESTKEVLFPIGVSTVYPTEMGALLTHPSPIDGNLPMII